MERQRDRRDPRTVTARGPGARALEDRARIAQTTARLIAEHGLNDWASAKRKAARELALPERTPMPSNEDIEQALLEYHALFGGQAHVASLHAQRRAALCWMHRLAKWQPLLVGGVAAGWASVHSDIRVEVVADDPKAVEMALLGDGVAYTAAPTREDGAAELRIDTGSSTLRLSILTPIQRRNRPRRPEAPRLDVAAVAAVLEANDSER